MSDIYIDREKYRSAAAALRQMAADLDDSRRSMAANMGFVGDAWQGAASDAFLESNEWTLKDIERLRFDMENFASDLDAAAAAFEV